MAITITYKSSIYSTTAGNLTASPTWTPAANSLLIACVVTSYASSPADPTGVSGHGIAYSKLTLGTSTLPAASSTHILSIWVAKAGASPTSAAAATTVTGTTTGSAIIEFEVTGANVSGTALQAIQASTATNIGTTGTAHTVTLASAASPNNRALTFCVHLSNTSHTTAGSWTLTTGATGSYNTPATGPVALFRNDAFDTAGAATGASVGWRMVGIEIKVGEEAFTAAPSSYAVGGVAATETLGDVTWDVLDDTLGASAASYSDLTATAETTYLYRVVAVNANGETDSNREEVTTPAAAAAYALVVDPGTLTATGVVASAVGDMPLSAAAGASTTTGTAATLPDTGPDWEILDDTLGPTAASYSDTTASASTTYRYRVVGVNATAETASNEDEVTTPGGVAELSAAPGSLTAAGIAASLALALTASAGAYPVTGTVASVVAAAPLTATTSSYTTTGSTATVALSAPLTATSGAYTLTGPAVTLGGASTFTASPAAYTGTGTAATTALTLSAAASSYATSGTAISAALGLSALSTSYPLTGRTAGALASAPLTATGGSLSLSGVAASFLAPGALTIELRQGATLIATRTVSPTTTITTALSTLTAPERALITDWTALRYAFIADGATIDVTWAALRTPAADLALTRRTRGLYARRGGRGGGLRSR